jgi:hypothetical protein
VFVTQQGQSQIFTGLATKEMVLAAKKDKEAVSSVQYLRMVGGKLLNSVGLRQRLGRMRMRESPMAGGAMSGGAKHGKMAALC